MIGMFLLERKTYLAVAFFFDSHGFEIVAHKAREEVSRKQYRKSS